MNLCGEVVKHKAFGRGEIIEFSNNYATVLFDESKEEKKFAYPAAFGAFLELENESFIKQIEEDKYVIEQKEAEEKRIREESAKLSITMGSKNDGLRCSKSASVKTSDKSNIAFKCNYCDGGNSKKVVGYKGVCSDDTIKFNVNVAKHIWCSQPENMCYKYLKGEVSREELCEFYESTKSEFSKSVCYESQMLEIWTAGAGITQNGDEKGKSMSLRNAKANSLALLTTKLPNAEDGDRFIFAVFLIDENHDGDNKEEGYVRANPKYKMELSLDEARRLKFWDYYFNPNKPEKIVFGSGLHRYFTDIQSAQVLKKICEIKKDTPEEEISKEFLEHYCRVKGLDIDDIPVSDGALQRGMSEIDISEKKCSDSGQGFCEENKISLVDVTSFEFFIGGYFGTSHYIYIDGKRKDKLIRYAKTPGGIHIDLKHLKNETNFQQDIFLKEIPLTAEQWILFIEEISNLKIAYWKDEYYDNQICDGTQWKLEIRLPYGNKISKCGSNEYPPCWNKFIGIMKKYIDDENLG